MFLKATTLLVLIYFTFVGCNENGKKVNCRKYVYAPICRGVGAKRDVSYGHRLMDINRHNANDRKDFLITILSQGKSSENTNKNPESGSNFLKALQQGSREIERDPGPLFFY